MGRSVFALGLGWREALIVAVAVPVVFGGKNKSVRVALRGLEGLGTNAECSVLHPGRGKAVPAALTKRGPDLILDVPLVRGCAMVRIRGRRGRPGVSASRSSHQ